MVVMLSMEKVLLILLILASSCTLPSSHFVHAFSSFSRTVVSSTANATPRTTKVTTVADSSRCACTENASPVSHEDTGVIYDNDTNTSNWATYALLFSSLSDGILPNKDARSFLRYSLVNSILREHIARKERLLESSVKFSPCNGPNTDTLNNMEYCDLLLERGRTLFPSDDNNAADSWSEETLSHLLSDTEHGLVDLRVLYIPTAMYALNPQSTNTPGKQRQRARSDGKQRRDQLCNLLKDLFSSNSGRGQEQIKLLAVTLDLEDGSLKHPYGSEIKSLFPENDIAAFTTWQPHLIYVEGGNTFWLQHCIDKGGYAELVKGACTGSGSAVYCGKSAGAIVAGERVDTATWKEWDDPSIVPGMGSYSDWINCRGMEFVGQHSFFPHMSDAWNDTVRDKVNSHNLKGSNSVYCLREHDACCVMGERKLVFLTSGPEAINANSSH